MDKLFSKVKKHWINIWLIVAAISFFAVTAYAVYTRITIAKRVVSTQAGEGIRFSSDYMSKNTTKTTEPKTDNTVNAVVPVHVYNYEFPKEAFYRSEETGYDLRVTIGTYDNNTDVFTPLSSALLLNGDGESRLIYSVTYDETNETVDFGDDNVTTYTFRNCVIPGGSSGEDLFTLVFDKNELGQSPRGYCIEMVAEPYSNELPTLRGLVMVRYSKQASSGWKGELEDLDANKDYDGFNYYLEGNGKGILTFRWDRTKVTINKDFLNNSENEFVGFSDNTRPVEATLTADSNGMVSLRIKVDSSEKRNRYEVQFFKVDPSYDYSKSQVEAYLPNTVSSDWVPDASSGD